MTDVPSNGTPPSADHKTMVGGYEIISKLGQGAMGTVFKARQVSMDRVIALKILKPSLARNSEFLDRFLREVRAAAQLNHPNIVQAYDAGQASGYSYFAMEYVDGHTLQAILTSGGALPEKRSLEIAGDVALALECAHGAGVIHRDVKPDNILIAADGTAKLADLGIARRTDSTDAGLTQAGMTLGTPNYISPEQVRGELDVDGRADIYALGGTLYHMLTGAPPYSGGTNAEVMSKHLAQPVPNAREVNAHVTLRTNALIKKAMAKNRATRHATVHDFRADVELLLNDASATVAASRPAPASPLRARERRPKRTLSPRSIAALAGAAVVLAIILLVALTPSSGPKKKLPDDRRALAAAKEWVAAHPAQHAAAIKRYESLKSGMTDRLCKKEVDEALSALRAARAKAATKVFAALQKRANELKDAGAYAEAIKTYRTAPRQFEDLLRGRIRQAMADIQAEGAAKIKAGLDRARALLDKGDAAGAMAEFSKTSRIQHSAFTSELQSLRKDIETARFKQTLAARKKVNQLLKTVDAAAVKRDLPEAARAARAGAADPELQCMKALAESLGKIGAALLRADAHPKKELAASTADEQVAAAILAFAAEDAAGMEAAVRQAGDHAFQPHYATKLQQLKERLQEREADKQQQQRTRLVEFRGSLPSALKKRRYTQVVAELDEIIADPQLPLIKAEAMTDRRALSKLVTALDCVRSNVRIEAQREKKTPTRHHGIPATIQAYDAKADKVRFSTGEPEAVTAMRATDLKMLLDLSPGPAAVYHEHLALLFIADGEPEKAQEHIPKVPKRADIQHLKKILGEGTVAAATPAGGDDPTDDAPPDTGNLTDAEKAAVQRALTTNRGLFKTYAELVSQERETEKEDYQGRMADDWDGVTDEVRYRQRELADEKSYARRSSYVSSYRRRRIAQLEREVTEALRKKGRLAEKIRNGLAVISKRAATRKAALRTVMLRNKRLLLRGKKVTEDQMTAEYEKVLEGNR